MKLTTTLAAWGLSLAGATLAVLGAMTVGSKPWLSYGYLAAAAALAFALLANPLSSFLIGLKGKWRFTTLMQVVVLGVGCVGIYMTLHQAKLHGMGFSSEAAFRHAQEYDLAIDFATGSNGKPKDVSRARELYRSACEGGIGVACNNLGIMDEDNAAAPEDHVRAGGLYEKGCAAGASSACFNRALQLDRGTSVPRDLSRALTFYERGCDLGLARSCLSAASILGEGSDGITQDTPGANALVEKACPGESYAACLARLSTKNH